MKLASSKKNYPTGGKSVESNRQDLSSWKILLVDDDPDIIKVTKLSLRNFVFSGLSLTILEANSAAEAKLIIHEHDDIAVLIVDVVMETDNAGLHLVEYIRDSMFNRISRIIISTGQPGLAPERYVIDNYDIDNYLTKTELTSQNLYAKLRLAIKGYRDLMLLQKNRNGLRRILSQVPKIDHVARQSESLFFKAVLEQVCYFCSPDSSDSSINVMIASVNGDHAKIEYAKGSFLTVDQESANVISLLRKYQNKKYQDALLTDLHNQKTLIPLSITGKIAAFVYIEQKIAVTHAEQSLLEVFLKQCSSILENTRLYNNLDKAYQKSIDTLAEIAEFKDKDTAEHINRIAGYTEHVAIEMGQPAKLALQWGQAARLHDVGKMGIPDKILLKPGKLTDDEFSIMRQHTVIGAAILGNMHAMELAQDIALSHHEHWDGSGYPEGRVAAQTSLPARIVGIADVFDALINIRCYKSAWTIDEAITYIKEKSGTQFDPKVTEAFLKLYDQGVIEKLILESKD